MKKIIGIFLIIIGLLMLIFGGFQFYVITSLINTIEIMGDYSSSYETGTREAELGRLIYLGIALLGLSLFIIGILIKRRARDNNKESTLINKEKQKNIEISIPPISDGLSDSQMTQLEKLAKLKEQGILSEEEFASEKKKILK